VKDGFEMSKRGSWKAINGMSAIHLCELIEKYKDKLSEKEVRVMKLRLGIADPLSPPCTIREIAEKMNLSERQILKICDIGLIRLLKMPPGSFEHPPSHPMCKHPIQ
jgi:DNA-directed RNA polymerase sigma subunit (sigma70/sigma32)